MKASEIIQLALDTNYGEDFHQGQVPFMCIALCRIVKKHAGHEQFNEVQRAAFKAEARILSRIEYSDGQNTLGTYLNKVDSTYRALCSGDGHESSACHEHRVNWYKQFIIELKESGE